MLQTEHHIISDYLWISAHNDIVLVHTAFMVPPMEYISQDFLK